jgi:outer membrane phospholipase A
LFDDQTRNDMPDNAPEAIYSVKYNDGKTRCGRWRRETVESGAALGRVRITRQESSASGWTRRAAGRKLGVVKGLWKQTAAFARGGAKPRLLFSLLLAANLTPAMAQPAPATPPSTNAAAPLMDFVSNHLSYYEPIYFILGTYPAAEFQVSIKYQLISFPSNANPFIDFFNHGYFAYTQTSFWDLFSRDPSFYDTSYKPSVFFYYTNVFHETLRNHFRLDLQGGTEHESNGRGGSLERSQYTVYAQPTATFYLPEHFQLSLQPRARYYYLLGGNNPDMAAYRGYAELLGALTWNEPGSGERIQLATRFRIGDEGSHAGWLFDLRFNLAGVPVLRAFNPTIQLQYFTGYGQTLIQYNQTSSAFRAGLCLWY